MLKAITDRRIREKLASVIDSLETDPELRGKPLDEDLAGYRSVRAVGQRYRIIYRVERVDRDGGRGGRWNSQRRKPRGHLPSGGKAHPAWLAVIREKWQYGLS